MNVLDSDFLIALLRKNPEVLGKLGELTARDEPTATTVFNAHEVLRGAMETKHNAEVTARFLRSLRILPYDFEAMRHALDVINDLKRKGTPIGLFDELVAGICRAANATIVTRNIKHFSCVPGLRVERW